MGTDLPAEPERPSIYGKARLQDGQFPCQDPKCPQYRSHGELAVGLAAGELGVYRRKRRDRWAGGELVGWEGLIGRVVPGALLLRFGRPARWQYSPHHSSGQSGLALAFCS